jgi:hypothetical protein
LGRLKADVVTDTVNREPVLADRSRQLLASPDVQHVVERVGGEYRPC